MKFSKPVLVLFQQLVANSVVSVYQNGADQTYQALQTAREELNQAFEELDRDPKCMVVH